VVHGLWSHLTEREIHHVNTSYTFCASQGYGLHHDADEPDSVIVTHTFPNLDAARAFAGNPGLRDAMARAGVVGQPIFWFGVLAVA
jgi:hypothetical protein